MKRLLCFSVSFAVMLAASVAWSASTSTVPWQSGSTSSDFTGLSEYTTAADPNNYTYLYDGTSRRITVLNLLKALQSPLTGFEIDSSNLPDIYGVLGSPTAWRLYYSDGSGVWTALEFGASGTYLKSAGASAAPTWDVAGGSGGGTIGGTLGSTDNVILRSDGTGGITAQGSLATISDAGTMNIPSGQTYNINGSAHTHSSYQLASAILTAYAAGGTPSANGLSLVSAANYAAMLTALGGQPVDTDLSALAAITRAQGSLIVGGASAWEGFAIGASGKVLKSTGTTVTWGDDNNDGGAGISTWDELGDSAADATIALGGYTTIFTSALDTKTMWTFTNTDASLAGATSFFDFKLTQNGSSNGFFMRGYDNETDLKWSIGPEGAFYGYSFETAQSATGGVLDLLEGSGAGTAYLRIKAPDAITGGTSTFTLSSSVANTEDLTILLGANNNTVTLGSTTSVDTFSLGAMNVVTTGTISGKISTVVENTATTWNVTTAQARAGTFFINTNAGTKTFVLPAAEAGMAVCVRNGQGVSQILSIDTDGTDYIVKSNGSRTTAAGDYYRATASAGNQICLVAFDTTDWYVTSETGVWTEE